MLTNSFVVFLLVCRTTRLAKQNVDLLKICLETNFNTYAGKLYTQTDGTLIDKSTSGPLEKGRVLTFAELVVKRVDDRFIMKVHRMQTHTNKYINWRSNVPRSVITEAMKALIFRAYQRCTRKEDLEDELGFLKDTFIANDCPIKVVDGVFGKYIPHRYKSDQAKSRSGLYRNIWNNEGREKD